jgi:hypothetical protein
VRRRRQIPSRDRYPRARNDARRAGENSRYVEMVSAIKRHVGAQSQGFLLSILIIGAFVACLVVLTAIRFATGLSNNKTEGPLIVLTAPKSAHGSDSWNVSLDVWSDDQRTGSGTDLERVIQALRPRAVEVHLSSVDGRATVTGGTPARQGIPMSEPAKWTWSVRADPESKNANLRLDFFRPEGTAPVPIGFIERAVEIEQDSFLTRYLRPFGLKVGEDILVKVVAALVVSLVTIPVGRAAWKRRRQSSPS